METEGLPPRCSISTSASVSASASASAPMTIPFSDRCSHAPKSWLFSCFRERVPETVDCLKGLLAAITRARTCADMCRTRHGRGSRSDAAALPSSWSQTAVPAYVWDLRSETSKKTAVPLPLAIVHSSAAQQPTRANKNATRWLGSTGGPCSNKISGKAQAKVCTSGA